MVRRESGLTPRASVSGTIALLALAAALFLLCLSCPHQLGGLDRGSVAAPLQGDTRP